MRAPRRASAVLEGSYPITAIAFSDQSDQLFACDTSGTVQVCVTVVVGLSHTTKTKAEKILRGRTAWHMMVMMTMAC